MIGRVSVVLRRTVVGDTHLDDHTIRTTDTPGFKPFTMSLDYPKPPRRSQNFILLPARIEKNFHSNAPMLLAVSLKAGTRQIGQL